VGTVCETTIYQPRYDAATSSLQGVGVASLVGDHLQVMAPVVWPGDLYTPPNDGTSCSEGW
jgi:hypothetical protein